MWDVQAQKRASYIQKIKEVSISETGGDGSARYTKNR